MDKAKSLVELKSFSEQSTQDRLSPSSTVDLENMSLPDFPAAARTQERDYVSTRSAVNASSFCEKSELPVPHIDSMIACSVLMSVCLCLTLARQHCAQTSSVIRIPAPLSVPLPFLLLRSFFSFHFSPHPLSVYFFGRFLVDPSRSKDVFCLFLSIPLL